MMRFSSKKDKISKKRYNAHFPASPKGVKTQNKGGNSKPKEPEETVCLEDCSQSTFCTRPSQIKVKQVNYSKRPRKCHYGD